MKILFVHPSCLLYSRIYLRLEPLGLELVAASARQAGHDVRIMDLQIFQHRDLFGELDRWRPDAVAFSINYLANVPEVIDLARTIRSRFPGGFTFVGGHSASFAAQAIIEDADGAIDCVVRGDGEEITPLLLETVAAKSDIGALPGVVTTAGFGPAPRFASDLNALRPARDLMRRRRKYFIGDLDPCASIEFARGCPWDCSFCSAWTFYGRSYRTILPEVAGEELERIREPHVFIVDDVAFIYPEHGMAIADEVERRGIRKRYYLETRGDVLLKNREVFKRWKRLGLEYMFLGIEAIDEDGLQRHRKRISLGKNYEALEFARSLGVSVAVNIIVDPSWDTSRFKILREWATSVPEIVNVTVNTPYPGTESWLTESRKFTSRDYRLFDTQHAVLPTTLPLDQFYRELIETQSIVNRKHLGLAALRAVLLRTAGLLCRGQTNFFKMLWKFNSIYKPEQQFQDHSQEVRYEMRLPEHQNEAAIEPKELYVHLPE